MASYIDVDDYSKKPYSAKTYANMRGVVDWGNLFQFAPYESGYCFIAVINAPYIGTVKAANGGCSDIDGFGDLQTAFVKVLEQEFKGLSGIGNITSDTMEISDGITSISLLGKVNQETNSQISMEFTEKTGSLITKYVSSYLRFVRDPKTEAKTYGGAINSSNARDVTPAKEVFNLLYIITDSTCLNVEKAFLILNAQPTEAAYGDLYNMNKGDISTKEVTVNFNAFVVDGKIPNKIALAYMRSMVNTGAFNPGAINTNSYNMDWSISGLSGNKAIRSSKIVLETDSSRGFKFSSSLIGKDKDDTGTVTAEYDKANVINIKTAFNDTNYSTYNPANTEQKGLDDSTLRNQQNSGLFLQNDSGEVQDTIKYGLTAIKDNTTGNITGWNSTNIEEKNKNSQRVEKKK